MKNHGLITIIRKSCLTGNAVWVYRGPSERSARLAYWRACRNEVERMKRFGTAASRRCANIARLVSDCMEYIPINVELTERQRDAARQLQSIQKKDVACHREFYEHIMAERLRRKNDREIRRRMRERENQHNPNYDK